MAQFPPGARRGLLGIPTTPVEIDSPTEAVFMNEISSEGIPLLALAQHFGLPTSLLDWTRIATKAAYFAASDMDFDETESSGRLAVWALRADILKSAKSADSSMMRVVYAPLASNPNLHAQSGIFTQAKAGEVTTVDDYIREHFPEHPEKADQIPSPVDAEDHPPKVRADGYAVAVVCGDQRVVDVSRLRRGRQAPSRGSHLEAIAPRPHAAPSVCHLRSRSSRDRPPTHAAWAVAVSVIFSRHGDLVAKARARLIEIVDAVPHFCRRRAWANGSRALSS